MNEKFDATSVFDALREQDNIENTLTKRLSETNDLLKRYPRFRHRTSSTSSTEIEDENSVITESTNQSIHFTPLKKFRNESCKSYKVNKKDVRKGFIILIAHNTFEIYLGSLQYRSWRDEEINNCYEEARLMVEIHKREGLEMSYLELNQSMQSLRLDPVRNSHISYSKRAFSCVDPLQRLNIAKSSFMSSFIGSVEGLPISVLILSPTQNKTDFTMTYVNAKFSEVSDISRVLLIGESYLYYFQDVEDKKKLSKIKKSLQNIKKLMRTHITINKGGLKISINLSLKPIFSYHGDFICFVCVLTDLKTIDINPIDKLMSLLPDRLSYNDGFHLD